MRCDNCNDIIHEDDYDVIKNNNRYCERCAEDLGFIRYPHNDMCGCEICALKYENEL